MLGRGGKAHAAGLLFTDLERSTDHARTLGDRYGEVLAAHHQLVRAAIEAEDGIVVGSEGDSLAAVLPTSAHAARAAVAAQRALAAHAWPGEPWRSRMAVHVGDVTYTESGAVGIALHEAARIRNTAHGGQIVLSDAARHLVAPSLAPDATVVELGRFFVRDLDGEQRLHQLTAPDLPADFPPLRTGQGRRVPVSPTSFVGRDVELEELLDLVEHRRMVTVTGAGGSGKTRLAYEAARRSRVQPVTVVELAAVEAAEQVAVTVSLAVAAPSPAAIAAAVADSPLLLVLDNCEHVLDAVVRVVAPVLAECPSVHVLATSRAPLSVAGEIVWAIPTLRGDDAAKLFRERAPRSLGAGDDATVAEVCRRLDGIPLAIELAAARLRSMPLDALAQRLDDQLRTLTTGTRDIPRQQTLRAALDWSHQLLDDLERTALRRLSVFAGGFSLEAATQVASRPTAIDLDAAIDGLVTKSLVQYDASADRYRLLEPIRQYARETLDSAGETAPACEAHLAWVERLSQDASRELSADQREWTARLDAERHNIGAAITYALERGFLGAATGIVSRLAFYWFTARRDEGEVWTARVLNADPKEPSERARALLAAGMVRCDSFEDHEVPVLLEEAADLFRAARSERALGNSLFWLGRARAIRADVAGARACFDEGAAVHEALGDFFGLGWCRVWLAILARELDRDLERSRSIAEDVLALGEARGIPHIVGAALGELASIAADHGDNAAARRHLREAIDLYRMVGDRWQEGTLMTVHAILGDAESAAGDVADLIDAITIHRELHAVANIRGALTLAAHHLASAGRRSDAALLLGAATARAPELFAFSSVPLPPDPDGLLQSLLDDLSLANDINRGRTMAFDAVVDLAIDELKRLYPVSASTST